MLTPEQVDAIRDRATTILAPIEAFLLKDIARRIADAGQFTSTAAYQIWRAQQLGLSRAEIKRTLRKLLKVSHEELEKLLTQTAEVGYNFDIKHLPAEAVPFEDNTSLQQIVRATIEQAQDDLTNVTQTLGMVAPDGKAYPLQAAYHKAMDFAFNQVTSGAADYHTALRLATKELANKGLRVIDYESGVHTSLEAATRRNILGGLGLMQERISKNNYEQLGADGWEISAHANSAPDHEPIQGRQYSNAEYQRINSSLHRPIGTLNCGHAAFPILLGVNRPQYTEAELKKFADDNAQGFSYQGKHYSGYEASQKQRSIERAIRRQKNRILVDEATGDKTSLQQDQIRMFRLQEEYRRFSKAANLRTEEERLFVAGFEKSSSKMSDNPLIKFERRYLAKEEAQLLPNRSQAIISPEKLVGYALNKEHPTGKHKAVAFEKALGYTIDNKDLLLNAVYDGLERWKAQERKETEFGKPYAVKMLIKGANGRYAKVLTSWLMATDQEYPRLTSIYIDD